MTCVEESRTAAYNILHELLDSGNWQYAIYRTER